MRLPTMYTSPAGAMGSRTVAQPYNTASMYTNLMPRGYADGGILSNLRRSSGKEGSVTELYQSVLNRTPSPSEVEFWQNQFGNAPIGEKQRAQFFESAQPELQSVANQQKAARDAVEQKKAMKRAQGYGTAYANINAGLSALAPEVNPMDTTDITFGARNRQAQLANLQQTYGPMLQNQRDALTQQRQILQNSGPTPPPAEILPFTPMPVQPPPVIPSPYTAAPPVDRYSQMVQDQYARIGRTGFGDQTSQIDTPGFNYFVSQLQSGQIRPEELSSRFDTAVQDYLQKNPDDRYSQYVRGHLGLPAPAPAPQPRPEAGVQNPIYHGGRQEGLGSGPPEGSIGDFPIPPQTDSRFMNRGGIAALAQGGYPRMNGQISGPGTEKSDSIPAMLSDGEFVMTAKAVRGAGSGSRREGAKKMYKLMHQLERNAQRG